METVYLLSSVLCYEIACTFKCIKLEHCNHLLIDHFVSENLYLEFERICDMKMAWNLYAY